MNLRRALSLALGMAAVVALAGCSKDLRNILVPNQPPVVRLSNAPVDTTNSYFYAYKLNWIGFDPDGRVAYFDYAVDPPSAAGQDTAWVRTDKNEQILFFRSSQAESLHTAEPRGQDFHVFVIRAIDNQGARSPVVSRAFFSYTVAPTVQIDSPIPYDLLEQTVTPAVIIRWSGTDVDGQFTQKPVKYKFTLIKYGPGDPLMTAWLQDPDSLRRQFAPTFAGWDSSTADTTFRQYTNLIPNSHYLFAIVAFDEAGAYSPVFTLHTNLLRLNVGFAGTLGPHIGIFSAFFSYEYPSGGYSTDPSRAIKVDVPADSKITFFWYGIPDVGSDIRRFRWVLTDDPDFVLDDNTARNPEETDLGHWSQWSKSIVSATFGPFDGVRDTSFNFYLECEDINGLVSLGWVQLTVVKPSFDKGPNGLLIVDDTRLLVDYKIRNPPASSPDSIQAPAYAWPTAAELDTFLYARGGVRWKMTPNGTLSPPGIFKGYQYDTLNTRTGRENPTVPLALLGRYRHIIWMLNAQASLYHPSEGWEGPTGQRFPETTLRYMCDHNHQNTLASWVAQGGQLWTLGGGIANASLADWNNRTNDLGGRTYTSLGTRPELVPGRFMYDIAHWQSEIRPYSNQRVTLSRVDQPNDYTRWPGSPLRTEWRSFEGVRPAPLYSLLPPTLDPKDPSTDPLPPYRNMSDFYLNNISYSTSGIDMELLTVENIIRDDLDGNPDTEDDAFPVLDSLYLTDGNDPSMNQYALDQTYWVNPSMTIYHGKDSPNPSIFQGFNIWNFRRDHCIQLLDWVLQTLWGLPHDGSSRSPAAAPLSVRRR